ncbi:MAG: exodeoxyribonuclease VII small subunit [Parachlamydiales bacterium]|nr:exodeoxyribonuclease VII small subunit [Parachlamydiales bacterium]
MTEDINYEKAFNRLEEILEKMNEGKASLDSSIKLFEEADTLIAKCTDKLNYAEQKIEKLIKKRNGDLELEDNKPKTEEFESSNEL